MITPSATSHTDQRVASRAPSTIAARDPVGPDLSIEGAGAPATSRRQVLRVTGMAAAFVGLGAAPSDSLAQQAATAMAADTTTFKALTDALWDAWSTRNGVFDASRLDRFYAMDTDLMFFDMAPPLDGYPGWAAYRANMVEHVYPAWADIEVRGHDDLKVWRRGPIALTTRKFDGRAVSKAGKAVEYTGRQTNVWELRGEVWFIVHEHGSVPFELK